MNKELRGEYPARVLCRLLGVSGSGPHARLARKPSARDRARERLKAAAPAAHQRTRQTSGAGRLQKGQAADGSRVSLGTVRSVRREPGPRCVQQQKRSRARTTDSRPPAAGRPEPVGAGLHGRAPRRGPGGRHHLGRDRGGLALCGGDQGPLRGRGRRARLRPADDDRPGRARA